MNSRVLCLVSCFLGLALLAGSWIWQREGGLGGQMAFSEQEAQAYVAAGNKFHQITYEHDASQRTPGRMLGGMQRQVSDGELAAAKDAWEVQKKQRDDAIGFIEFWGKTMFGLGVLLVGGGGAGFFIAKNMAEES